MGTASSPPVVAARHAEGEFEGRRGVSIWWQSWFPAQHDPRAVVVIAHGAGEHGGRYRYVVERLVPENFAVYAVDHRGHGRSGGRRAQIDRMDDVVADLDVLVDHVRGAHPGRPHFLLGHSMGGTAAIAYALAYQAKLDGLVLSAPLAAVAPVPAPARLAVRLIAAVAPDLPFYRVDAAGISRDAGEVLAYRTDPLVHQGRLPIRTVVEMVETVARFEPAVARLAVPLLVLVASDDRIVLPAGGRMVHDRAGSTDKALHVYDECFHEVFNAPPADRARVLDDLAAWLIARADG